MAEINELISKEALASLEKLMTDLDKVVVSLDKIVASSTQLDASFGKLSVSTKNTASAQKEVNKANDEATKISKQLKEADDEEVKAKIRFANATKEQRDTIKAQINAEKAASDSLIVMKQKLAELNKEYQAASGALREKLAPQMKQLTDNISSAEKAIGNHTRSVGGYAEGIKEAGKMLFNFAGLAGIAMGALNKLKEAFADTEMGVKFFRQIKEASSSFFQSLITGQSAMAGINAVVAANAAKGLDALRIRDREEAKSIAALEVDIKLLRLRAATEKDATKQLELYKEADQKENKAIELKTENLTDEINLLRQLQASRPEDAKLADEINQKEIELIQIRGDKNVRIQSKIAAGEEKIREAILKRAEETKKAAELKQKADEITIENNKEVNDQLQSSDADLYDWKKEMQKESDDLMRDSIDYTLNLEDKRLEKLAENRKKEEDALKEKEDLKKELISSTFELADTLYAAQLTKLDAQKDAELKRAGNDEKKKEQIEEKYSKAKNKIARKQAIANKAEGLFNIAISTAEAIAKIYAQLGAYATLLVPLVLAMAAVQTANIIAQPLPQYAKGTNYASGGLSVVGEKGSELVIDPSGRSWLTSDSPELVNLKRGSKIYPSDETKKILSAAGNVKRNDFEALQERRHKELIRTIKEKDTIILGTSVGAPITKRSGNNYKTYFERHLNFD